MDKAEAEQAMYEAKHKQHSDTPTTNNKNKQRTTIMTQDNVTLTKPEWQRIIKSVEKDLMKEWVDLQPINLPEIIAQLYTRETKNGKGIILMGDIGTGKTRRLEYIKEAFNIPSLTTADIFDMFATDMKYIPEDRIHIKSIYFYDLIIDDLGSEQTNLIVNKNQYCPLAIVIEERYKLFPELKTYFGTSLTKEQLLEKYGERTYSRLNEMCNFVTLPGTDRRMYDIQRKLAPDKKLDLPLATKEEVEVGLENIFNLLKQDN